MNEDRIRDMKKVIDDEIIEVIMREIDTEEFEKHHEGSFNIHISEAKRLMFNRIQEY